MNSLGSLEGKSALVTGADTGIGREIALEFARQGADVLLHFSHDEEGATSAAREIEAMGRRASVFGADFDSVDQAIALGDRANEIFGAIDCLINNAGITFNKPFLDVTPAQFDKLLHVNFRGQYFLTQRIVSKMLERRGGSICNISSIHGLQGAPEHSAYAASKGAIIAYTRALAVELAHRNIRVNSIAPGWITVQNYFKAIPNFNEADASRQAHDAVPVGRYGLPVEVAYMAAFLCSDQAQFLIGQTITVDGGTTALMSLINDFRSTSVARFGTGYMPE